MNGRVHSSKSMSWSIEGQNSFSAIVFPCMLNTLAQNYFVEPRGVEPQSSQGNHVSSTCLVAV